MNIAKMCNFKMQFYNRTEESKEKTFGKKTFFNTYVQQKR